MEIEVQKKLTKLEFNGEYQEIIKLCNQLICKGDSNSYYYFSRGVAFFELGKHTAAVKDFSLAIEAENKDTFSYVYRGDTYFEIGNYKKAVRDYRKALALIKKEIERLYADTKCYKDTDPAFIYRETLAIFINELEDMHKTCFVDILNPVPSINRLRREMLKTLKCAKKYLYADTNL